MALDTEEARRARYREIIQSLTLMDDIFMTAVFQDSLPCVDLVLQIILDRPNLHATSVVTQGSHIVYVNSSIVDTETPLGRLMHDFHCMQPEEMYYEVLAERTGGFKKSEEGVIGMNATLEKLIEERVESAYIDAIRAMMEKLQLTAENAMDVLSIPQSEWGRYKAML